MSLEYYIFCKDRYQEIILHLENVIESYDLIIDCTNTEEKLEMDYYNIFQPEHNKSFFINSLNHVKQLKNICDNKINKLCVHEFENDSIDITPDRSENITYCKLCGYTK
jgi:hypothetical protein